MLVVDWRASREAVSRSRRILCGHGSRKVDRVLYRMLDELSEAPQQGPRLMGRADCRKTFSPAQVYSARVYQAKGLLTPSSTAPLMRRFDLLTDLQVVQFAPAVHVRGFAPAILFEGRVVEVSAQDPDTVVDSASKIGTTESDTKEVEQGSLHRAR